MIDKTPEEVIALAKQCGARVDRGFHAVSATFSGPQLQAFATALTAAQPVQPAEHDEIATVLEVLDKHAPFTTGSLLARVSQLCLITPAAQPVQLAQPVLSAAPANVDALDAARSAEQGDIKDAQRLDYCYQQAMGAFINAPITKQQWLNGLDAAIAARGAI